MSELQISLKVTREERENKLQLSESTKVSCVVCICDFLFLYSLKYQMLCFLTILYFVL